MHVITTIKPQIYNSNLREFQSFQSESGVVSKKDFEYILSELGEIRDKAVVDEIFAEADVDGDGVLNYDEFTFMVRNYMIDEDLNTCRCQ